LQEKHPEEFLKEKKCYYLIVTIWKFKKQWRKSY